MTILRERRREKSRRGRRGVGGGDHTTACDKLI